MKALVLLCTLLPLVLCAQQPEIDSLKQVIETTRIDSVRGRTYCRLCLAFRKASQAEEARAAGLKGLSIVRQAKDREGEGDCLERLAMVYAQQGELTEALQTHQLSYHIREEAGDSVRLAKTLRYMGILYNELGDFARALDFQLRSLRIREQLGDRPGVASSLISVGVVLEQQNDYAQARVYFEQALHRWQELGELPGVAACQSNLANLYFYQQDYAKAIEWDERSYALHEQLGMWGAAAANLSNICAAHLRTGALDQALAYSHRSLAMTRKTGSRFNEPKIFSLLSAAHLRLGRVDSARWYARQAVDLAQQMGHLEFKINATKALYRADSALGNWKAAFDAHQLLLAYADSSKNDEQSRELGRLQSKYAYDKQAEADRLLAQAEQNRQRERYTWMLGSAGGGLVLLLIIALTLFRGRQIEKRSNTALRALNEEIQQQKAEIEAVNAELQTTLLEVNEQKHRIEAQHAKIEDSIRYASRIQYAILPSEPQCQTLLPPHFIHYQPRDIVSGDFYWLARAAGRTYLAAVDCTGHGVPGAFMSVLGANLLHQIVEEQHISQPDVVLAELDRRIAAMLRQHLGGESKDGMDVALVVLHEANPLGVRVIEFAGAGRPLWQLRGNILTECKSAKYACGGSQHRDKVYPPSQIEAQVGDRLYLFSDGVTDQFGGPHGRKLGPAGLQAFLVETAEVPIKAQGAAFTEFFHHWMAGRKQLDDVLLVGIEV